MKIYLAAPVSKPEDREANRSVASFLRTLGHEVFMPQELGVAPLMAQQTVQVEGKPYDMAYAEAQEYVWSEDIKAMNRADACFIVLTRPCSEGTAFEAGYMTAQGKPVVGKKGAVRVGTVLTNTVKWFENIKEAMAYVSDAQRRT